VAALAAGVLTAGCLVPMDTDATWRLTFRGQVDRAGSAAAVPGARVEIWVDPPEPLGNAPAFVTGETNAQGEFVLGGTLRAPGVSPDVVVRITPPAQSGLQGGSFTGHVSQLFGVAYAEREYTYTGDFTLQPAS
jgi:hypothetical protein